jgi:four helix bundle protein
MTDTRGEVSHDIKKRMYAWSLGLIRVLEDLPYRTSNDVLSRQLIRCGTSVCANYLEAQAAVSRKDFTNFIAIALKSANESKYWLTLLKDLKKITPDQYTALFIEVDEFSKILGASIVTLKKKK